MWMSTRETSSGSGQSSRRMWWPEGLTHLYRSAKTCRAIPTAVLAVGQPLRACDRRRR
jgi:hypothetical protein